MCGIAGLINYKNRFPLSRDRVHAMADVLKHRGPDEEGYYFWRDGAVQVGFGHRRLSIIDLVTGHQPMSNEDGTIWIVYNGEIYNHLDLRVELESKGHIYRTTSDTETIIHLYEEYGERCVEKLRGMFAFAIWDEKRRRLFAARDRIGIKPFYYTVIDGCLAFASEIKGILASGWVQPEINWHAFPEYLAFGYISSHETLFSKIYKLMPGHWMLWENGDVKVHQYWDMTFHENSYKPDKYYFERFREIFEESVRIHLMSDVPLGVFLSGGLDSSSVATTMVKFVDEPIKTFSVGFERQYYSEFDYAREVARHINSDHHEIILKPKDFFESLPKLIWHEDEPIKAPPSIALYFVAKLAGEHVKVVLTGEGSDELFAGYDDRYWMTLWNRKLGHYLGFLIPDWMRYRLIRPYLWKTPIPLMLKKVIWHTFLYHNPDDMRQILFDSFYTIFTPEVQEQLLSPEVWERIRDIDPYASSLDFLQRSNAREFLNRMLYADVKTYLLELLMKQDNMSMAASIESRVPFLDNKLVEFACEVPPHLKLNGRNVKYIVKRALQDRLPESIINRSKIGFPVPFRAWIKTELGRYAWDILLDDRTRKRGYFNVDFLERLMKEHIERKRDNGNQIWTALNFELWNRIFIDSKGFSDEL